VSDSPPLRSIQHEHDRIYRRAITAGLLVSAVAHVLLFVVTGRVGLRPTQFIRPAIETEPAPRGLVVVEVPVTPEGPESETPRPEPEEPSPIRPDELEVIRVVPTPAAEVEPEVTPDEPIPQPEGEPEERLTNAQRLRPRFSDARLWVDPRDPMIFGARLERLARADSAVRAILRDWLDSLRLTEEQRQRALDWTYENDGKRWGISPEGLHLGDITIPLPFQLMPTGPQRREFEQALRDLRAIQNQDMRSDLDEIRKERMEEMRRRSQEEVERRRSGDTTSVRFPGPR
jgi:hypothetical protein